MRNSNVRMLSLTILLYASLLTASPPYEIRHPYTITLDEDTVVRGSWAYKLRSKVKYREGGRRRVIDPALTEAGNPRTGSEGPFDTTFGIVTFKEKVDARLSDVDRAWSEAEIEFDDTGGFHAVRGDADIANAYFASSYAKSGTGINFGTVRPRGNIRWSPRWKVDVIAKGRTVVRDPIDLTLRDRDSGLALSDTFLDIHFDSGPGGSGSWEDGRIQLNGFDGEFRVDMNSPYLTTPGGSMLLEYDANGIVTFSEDSGVFDGILPAVGQRATLDTKYSDGVDGGFDVGFDFTRQNHKLGPNLVLDGELSGHGMRTVYGDGPEAGALQDFSYLQSRDRIRLVGGTEFHPRAFESRPTAPLLRRPEGSNDPTFDDSPYSGFMRLTDGGEHQLNSVAFDQPTQTGGNRISAEFDFRINDQFDGEGQAAGLAFSLLPTDNVGEAGPLESPFFGNGLTLTLDTREETDGCLDLELFCPGQKQNAVTLDWQGKEVGQFILDQVDFDLQNNQWNKVNLEISQVPQAAFVTATIHNGANGEELILFEDHVIEEFYLPSVRAAFVASADFGVSHDIDNLFLLQRQTGDFDADGVITPNDIDELTFAMRVGDYEPIFDLNQDGAMDLLDREIWIHDLAGVLPGDLDLNGEVGFSDFLQLSANFGGEGTWAMGDTTGDGQIQFDDFLQLSTNFGQFGMRPDGPIASVPEPTAMCCVFCVAAGWVVLRERKSR